VTTAQRDCYRASRLPAGLHWVTTIHIDLFCTDLPLYRRGCRQTAHVPYLYESPRGSNASSSSELSLSVSMWLRHCQHGAYSRTHVHSWGIHSKSCKSIKVPTCTCIFPKAGISFCQTRREPPLDVLAAIPPYAFAIY
jgi:hypothetical protein